MFLRSISLVWVESADSIQTNIDLRDCFNRLCKHPKDNSQKFFGVWPFFAKKGQNLGELFMKSSPNPAKIFNNFNLL